MLLCNTVNSQYLRSSIDRSNKVVELTLCSYYINPQNETAIESLNCLKYLFYTIKGSMTFVNNMPIFRLNLQNLVSISRLNYCFSSSVVILIDLSIRFFK